MFRILACCFAIAVTAVAASPAAQAAQCHLEVQGKTYLDGPCYISVGQDGSFTMWAGDTLRPSHKAGVVFNHLFPGVPFGYWNGPNADVLPNYPLGHLFLVDGCWANHQARICAVR